MADTTFKVIIDTRQASGALTRIAKNAALAGKALSKAFEGIDLSGLTALASATKKSKASTAGLEGALDTLTLVASNSDNALISINSTLSKMSAKMADAGEAAETVGKKSKGITFGDVTSGLKRMGAGALRAGQAIAEVVGALGRAAAEGQQLQQLAGAFESLGGSASELDKLRDATKNLVPDAELQKMFNMAKLFKINQSRVSEFAEIAVGASVATGESVGKMFSDILTAGARGSRLIADNLGILINVGEVNKKKADELGKSVNDLTDAEKALAFQEGLVAGATQQRALAQGLANTEVASASVSMTNFVNELKMFAAEALVSSGAMEMMGDVFVTVKAFFDENQEAIKSLVGSGLKLLGNVLKNVAGLAGPLAKALGAVAKIFNALAPIAMKLTGAIVSVAAGFIDFVDTLSGPVVGILEITNMALGAMGQALGLTGDESTETKEKVGGLGISIESLEAMFVDVTAATHSAADAQSGLRAEIRDTTDSIVQNDEALQKLRADLRDFANQGASDAAAAFDRGDVRASLEGLEGDMRRLGDASGAAFKLIGSGGSGAVNTFVGNMQAGIDRAREFNAQLDAAQESARRTAAMDPFGALVFEGRVDLSERNRISPEHLAELQAYNDALLDAAISEQHLEEDQRSAERATTERARRLKDAAKNIRDAFGDIVGGMSELAGAIGKAEADLVGFLDDTNAKMLTALEAASQSFNFAFQGITQLANQGAKVVDEIAQRTANSNQFLASSLEATFGAASESITALMTHAIAGGESFRENMFQIMGSLFGQISTAFIAWATAEGAILSGNPIAAAAAAGALGLVASAISAFGTRKPGSGGGGSNSTAARKRSESDDRDRDPRQTVIVQNYGLAMNDSQVKALSRSLDKGDRMTGRRRAA